MSDTAVVINNGLKTSTNSYLFFSSCYAARDAWNSNILNAKQTPSFFSLWGRVFFGVPLFHNKGSSECISTVCTSTLISQYRIIRGVCCDFQ
jgi:hypothetical protein